MILTITAKRAAIIGRILRITERCYPDIMSG